MTLLQTLRLIRSDYRGFLRVFKKGHSLSSVVNFALFPGLMAAALYRLSHWLHVKGGLFRFPARLIYIVNHTVTGADINAASVVGEGFVMLHSSGHVLTAKVGKNVTLTVGVQIGGGFDQTDIGAGPGLPVVGDNVLFAPGCTVLGPLRVGDGACVLPKSLVVKDVPPGAKVFGNPARVVGTDFKNPWVDGREE